MCCLILRSESFLLICYICEVHKRTEKGVKDQKGKGMHGLGSPEGGNGGKALLTAGGITG